MSLTPEERSAPEIRWQDLDTHRQALAQRKAEEASFRDRPFTIEDRPVHVDEDPHRAKARKQLVTRSGGFGEIVGAGDPDLLIKECQRASHEFNQRQAQARLEVKLAEATGVTVPEDVRRVADTPSRQAEVDAILERRVRDRQLALAEANREVVGRNDGTRVEVVPGDPFDLAQAGQRTLAGVRQVADHRARSEGPVGPVPRPGPWW
jgi:hypothetical protein